MTSSATNLFPQRWCEVHWLVLIAVIGAGNGCSHGGPKLYPATGQVTFNDEPLANAGIVFLPDDPAKSALLATARTDANGEFTLVTNMRPGIAEGDYTASVTAMKEHDFAAVSREDPKRPATAKTYQPPKLLIPRHYTNPNSSGLSFTVLTTGKNHFEIQLTGTSP